MNVTSAPATVNLLDASISIHSAAEYKDQLQIRGRFKAPYMYQFYKLALRTM